MPFKWLVGLGNDEARYQDTPHNVGFHALDALCRRWNADWREWKGQAYLSSAGPHFLLKPKTYMNVSGPVVRGALDFWKAPSADLLVVCDDFALPWGRLRFRRRGSSGGHNGLESVIEALGSDDFARLRLGVGPVPEGMDAKDYVLRRQPAEKIKALADRAAEALEAAAREGLDPAMNRYNSDSPTT